MPINGTYTPYDLDRVWAAIHYIHAHYRDYISADQLAIEAGLDIKLLQALMQDQTGLTVHHYVLKVRLDRSAELLADFSKPVKFIALTHGFSSPSHYIGAFKKHFGLTPKKYRYQLLQSRKQFG